MGLFGAVGALPQAAGAAWSGGLLSGYPAITSGSHSSRRRLVAIQASHGEQGRGVDALQVGEKGAVANGSHDVMKLFNDAQQNMLYLNKQRLIAMEQLQTAERDKELLLARVAQLEAENQAGVVECHVLQRNLKQFEDSISVSAIQGGVPKLTRRGKIGRREKADPPAFWSELLLRIDSMVLTGAIKSDQAITLRGLVCTRNAQAAEVFEDVGAKDDMELAAGLLSLLDPNRGRGLHVVHICTEMAPATSSGSLATNVTNLCRALRRKGHLVEVILPKYASLDLTVVDNLQEVDTDLYSYFGGDWHKNKLWTGTVYGIAVTFIEPFHPADFFSRAHLHDYDDDFERFTYFCRASLEYLKKLGKQADIVHLHNWQTAAVAPLFWDIYAHHGLGNTRLLFTCHDFKYQCLQEPHKLALCGLDPGRLNRPDRLQDNFEPNLINLLKGGVVYSNKVITVSPIYATDLLTREHGYGLDVTLNTHKHKFIGIFNGLDETMWDPMQDRDLAARYSVEDLSGKSSCKAVLRQRLDLLDADSSVPLVGCIVPEVSELELMLMRAALACALSKAAQFVFVGQSKCPRVQAVLEDMQRDHAQENAKVIILHDDTLVHQVLAASDILVCPAIFEPTGEWPLIAMRYGTVPVARQIKWGPRQCD